MNTWKYVAFIALIVVFLPAFSGAQPGQMPPPRVIGTVQVDKISQAPLRVVRSVALDATPQEVFAFVSDHANWPKFLGLVESVEVTGSGRRGSTRAFALVGGGTVSERIVAYDEPNAQGQASFAYSVSPDNPFGVANHLAVVTLRPADDGGALLAYHQIFDHPEPQVMVPAVAQGTDEILAHILYRFGGELRGAAQVAGDIVIEAQRVVDASSARAWEVLGEQWGDVDAWASLISHSESRGGKGGSLEGATRSCVVPGTPGFRETMIAYNEDELMLRYQVLEGMPPFVQKATNTWNLSPLSADRVVVRSRIDVAIAVGTPEAASSQLLGQFTQILDMTTDELAHFIETRQPHPRKVAAVRASTK